MPVSQELGCRLGVEIEDLGRFSYADGTPRHAVDPVEALAVEARDAGGRFNGWQFNASMKYGQSTIPPRRGNSSERATLSAQDTVPVPLPALPVSEIVGARYPATFPETEALCACLQLFSSSSRAAVSPR